MFLNLCLNYTHQLILQAMELGVTLSNNDDKTHYSFLYTACIVWWEHFRRAHGYFLVQFQGCLAVCCHDFTNDSSELTSAKCLQ